MATKLRAESAQEPSQDATQGHNAKARADVIVESFKRLYELDREIKVLTEDHLKELKDEKSDIKARLREDFGMTARLVQARYGLYRVEREAEDASDNVTLDAIHELFEVLPVGGMVDLVSAIDRAKSPEEKARAEGYRDGKGGMSEGSCPHPMDTPLSQAWMDGWYKAEAERDTRARKTNGPGAAAP